MPTVTKMSEILEALESKLSKIQQKTETVLTLLQELPSYTERKKLGLLSEIRKRVLQKLVSVYKSLHKSKF